TVLDPSPRVLFADERTALANIASLAVARAEAQREAPRGDRLEDETRRRRAAEEKLAAEREFSAALLDNLTGAFYLVAADGRMVRWNGAFAAAMGYGEAEISAMRPEDFVSTRDRSAISTAMREVLDHGRDMSLEGEIVDRAGNVRPYMLTGRPVHIGGKLCMIGV